MDTVSYLLGKKNGGGSGTTNYNDLSNKPSINDISLSGNKTSSDLGIQEELVSGTNIKTINNESILGSGDLSVSGYDGDLEVFMMTDYDDFILNLDTAKVGIYMPQKEMQKIRYSINGTTYSVLGTQVGVSMIYGLVLLKKFSEASENETVLKFVGRENRTDNTSRINLYLGNKSNGSLSFGSQQFQPFAPIFGTHNVDIYPEYKFKSYIPQYSGTGTYQYDTQLTTKKYVDDKPTTYTGYDATKTQVLKNINGTLTWVTEE